MIIWSSLKQMLYMPQISFLITTKGNIKDSLNTEIILICSKLIKEKKSCLAEWWEEA